MKSRVYRLVQLAGRRLGLEIRRNGPSARDELRLAHFLRQQQVELLFDIGANRGQFAQSMFDAGFGGRIVSFEAMPTAHEDLSRLASLNAAWDVAPQGALSDQSGEIQFHVTCDRIVATTNTGNSHSTGRSGTFDAPR
jgi:hypothetical protein